MSQDQTKNNDPKAPVIPNQGKGNGDQANWQMAKVAAKKSWGSLTDEDFKKANHSVDKLCSVIYDRFGGTTESIKATLNKSMAEAKPMTEAKPAPTPPVTPHK